MSRNPMPRIKFISIRNDLKGTTKTIAAVAADHRTSTATVERVNHAATYDNYLSHKRAPHTLRQFAKSAQARLDRAQKAGLNPVTREQREERKFAAEIEKIVKPAQKPVTHAELTTELHYRDERINAQGDIQRRDHLRLSKEERNSRIALGLSIASIVIVILKVVL